MQNPKEVRSAIDNLISSLIPYDLQEKEDILFVKDWLNSGAEIFRITKPHFPPIHLVSYFILIDGHECLLVDHKKAQLWLPPGGHVEVNEHPKETVKREVKEELNIDADFLFEHPVFLTVTKTVGLEVSHTDVSLWYVLKGNKNKPLNFDRQEFHYVCWFDCKDIPFERADPHMKRFINKIFHPLVTLHRDEVSPTEYAKNI